LLRKVRKASLNVWLMRPTRNSATHWQSFGEAWKKPFSCRDFSRTGIVVSAGGCRIVVTGILGQESSFHFAGLRAAARAILAVVLTTAAVALTPRCHTLTARRCLTAVMAVAASIAVAGKGQIAERRVAIAVPPTPISTRSDHTTEARLVERD